MKSKQNDLLQSNFPPKMGQPAFRAITEAGYQQLEQLTEVSEAQLKKLHGVGPKAINELRQALEAKGLSFADDKSHKG